MATLATLRKQAKEAGIPRDMILRLSSTTLESMIEDAKAHENGATAKPRKKSAAKAAVRKAASTPKRRGRPVGSKNKPKAISKSASAKSKPAAKSTQGKAKRSTSVSKSDSLVTRNYTKKKVEKTDGRYTLDKINYSQNEDWNPRPGSTPDVIQRLLKRFRGDRNKVFLNIYDDGLLYEHVGRKKQDGSKRTEAEAIAMLKYRIARTDWDFAMKTGQHEKSENRIEYGTGENATVRAKKPTPKKRTTAARKPVAKKATAKKATTTPRKPVRRRVAVKKASTRK